MADALDGEIIGLINRLNKVQAEVGGTKKNKHVAVFGEDGKIVFIGRGFRAGDLQRSLDHFMEPTR
jgi:hypothetical protein